MSKIKAIEELFSREHSLAGKKFQELSNDEKQILYALKLYEDNANLSVIADTVLGAHPNFVDTQLRVAFRYTDETQL
jgi:hypothetical protein